MRKSKFLTSVIIPTYNREMFILEALESVALQTAAPYEVIVIDDGSTDRTQALITKHFPFVVYLRTPNQGVSTARNTGFQISKGNIIAFLDSDDLWLPRKLEEQLAYLEKNPQIRILHCNEEWRRTGKLVPQKKYHEKKGGELFFESLPRCMISPSAVIMRREIMIEFGQFDEDLAACEDYDLWLRITSSEPVGFVEKTLVVKRGGHADQLSKRVPSLDRYRIRSLEKIVKDIHLTPKKKLAAKREAIRKINIYRKGALKRGKHQRVKWADTLLSKIHSS